MDKRLLLNREWDIQGGWYAPMCHIRDNFKSVICCHLIDTMSSAGDWSGMFVQKIGKKFYIISFSQSNNYPNKGYTLHTDSRVTVSNTHPTYDQIEEIYSDLCE